MKFLLLLAFIVALLLVYALWGREWLKTKDWAAPFFAWIEPYEIALFRKSEVILFARLKVVTGVLLSLLAQLGAIDFTPLLPFLPEKYHGLVHFAANLTPLALTIVGWMDERLRVKTTMPIEVIAVPDKVKAENPKVAAAVEAAVIAKVEAVAVVKEEKAA